MKFSIITLGCKVNAYESQYYAGQLEELGYESDPSVVSRNLYFMKQNGVFDEINGLWIGNYQHESNIQLEKIVLDVLEDEEIKNEIKRIEESLHGKGRVLIRPSGTEPLVRVMLEGENQEEINEMAHSIVNLILSKI